MTMKMTKAEIEAIAMNAKELVKKFADAEAKAKAACEAVEAMRPEVDKAVAFMIELGDRVETAEKKQSKMWSINYPESAGNWRTYYLAKDVNIAYGGNGSEYAVREMLGGVKRGCYKELSRDEVRYIGELPEYRGSKHSYWIDETAVEELAEWFHDKERKAGKRNQIRSEYNETELIKRYGEVNSVRTVAEEFNVSKFTVYDALERNGIVISRKRVTPEMKNEIIRLRKVGYSHREIAKLVGVCSYTVCMVLRRNGYGKPLA